MLFYGRKYFNMLLMGFLLFSYVILFFSRGLAIISHSENAECIVLILYCQVYQQVYYEIQYHIEHTLRGFSVSYDGY